MAYKYSRTIRNSSEKLIDGIENIEMFLGEEDNWNFHDSEIRSFHWDSVEKRATVTVLPIGLTPDIEGWSSETDTLLDMHFEDVWDIKFETAGASSIP
nr:hypothetical protein [uncultured Bacteroides sp.]